MTHHPPPLLSSRPDKKPKVLLVDDHPGILKSVSNLLANDYTIAGVATGGSQAVDLARRVQPDAIVLDVNMPGLDGFQTLRALEHAGSRAPVVFLSMGDGEDFVSKAFASGGSGYVLKSRVTDLPSAIDHALSGRRFVPALPFLAGLAGGGGHSLHVHSNSASSHDGIAALLDLALRRGDAVCVIAPEDLREGLDLRLRSRGWDTDSPSVLRRYRRIEAADALNSFMHDGLPDARVLAAIAADLDEFRRAGTHSATSGLTVLGAMASVLLAEGNARGAIALERDWTAVTQGLPIVTVCAYAASWFDDPGLDVWPGVCAAHSSVSHSNDL